MTKVLFLNPPWKQKYLREYYCPKISKARFYYPAVDLIYMTGRFFKSWYDVKYLDSIAENKDSNSTIDYIINLKPNIVYFLTSSPSFLEDKNFILKLISKYPSAKYIWTWDIFRELKEKSFEIIEWLDAINLNFSSWNIINYLKNPNWNVLENIIYKHNNDIIVWKENFKSEFFYFFLYSVI